MISQGLLLPLSSERQKDMEVLRELKGSLRLDQYVMQSDVINSHLFDLNSPIDLPEPGMKPTVCLDLAILQSIPLPQMSYLDF